MCHCEVQEQARGDYAVALLEFTLQRAGFRFCSVRTLKRELQLRARACTRHCDAKQRSGRLPILPPAFGRCKPSRYTPERRD